MEPPVELVLVERGYEGTTIEAIAWTDSFLEMRSRRTAPQRRGS
jgi:hypothetical protein